MRAGGSEHKQMNSTEEVDSRTGTIGSRDQDMGHASCGMCPSRFSVWKLC